MPEPIRSRTNPLVKRLRASRARVESDGACLLEGGKLVLEALSAGIRLIDVAASARAERTEHGQSALDALTAQHVPVRWLDDDLLESISEAESSQGLLALAERPRFEPDAVFGRGDTSPLVLVAVEVQNPANLGALLRTSEAAGATGAILTRGCADPLSWKSLRGSMGSAFRLPHWRGADTAEVIDRLRRRGIDVAATDAAGNIECWDADLRGPLALVVGNEAHGLPEEIGALADVRLRVPVQPPVESLNVAVAAGIVLFEAARQRRRAG